MLSTLKNELNVTTTTNGATSFKSTQSNLVDYFATSGSLRNRSEHDIIRLFTKALHEDSLLAMKALFYTRDVRGGQGERKTFRTISRYLAFNHKDLMKKNLWAIPFFGRWDDLLVFLDSPLEKDALQLISDRLVYDMKEEKPSLLAKWLPSENASSSKTKQQARKIRQSLGLSSREYRKVLSKLRAKINLVESKMSANQWQDIEYDKLPSKAGLIYRGAFYRHDEEGYTDYVDSLVKGEKKVNVKTLFPYEIVGQFPISMSTVHRGKYNAVVGESQDEALLDAMWKSLPDYIGENFDNALAVVDTSGSMTGLPIQVALSLGLYLAERNKGEFHNHFITFSREPELQEIIGETLGEKLRNMSSANWQQNTNVESVFDLILRTAVTKDLPQDEMPSKIFIISDMQFDSAVNGSDNVALFENIRRRFAHEGYTCPELVFWNVNAFQTNFPVKVDETGTALVSGASPTIFKNLLAGKDMTPYTMMLDVLNGERYEVIQA